MKEESKYLPIEFQKNPWEGNDNNIWLSSTISLSRNMEKYKFPGKLAGDKRKQIVSLASKEMMTSSFLTKPVLINAEDMSSVGKEFLVEHFLTMRSFQHAHQGEAFIVDSMGRFLAALNVRDHILLHMIDCKGELENIWETLVNLESVIGKTMNFAFSPRFGFLTADPMMCGTALIVHVYLHLPALLHTGTFQDVMEKYRDDGMAVEGFQGSPNEFIGDIIAIHNNYTLGLTEENILSNLRTIATKLVVEEKGARSRIQQEGKTEIKDKVSRAYAVLLHSYQIEAVESFNAISLLKIAIDLGWIEGISHVELNALLFRIRRAHLLTYFGEQIAQDEISHRRADFVHQIFKNVTLKI